MSRFFATRGVAAILLYCVSHAAFCGINDPFGTEQGLSSSPAKDMLMHGSTQEPCRFDSVVAALDLLEAVERALCNNPQTHQVWANVQAQAAQVGIAQAAYLPTVSLTASLGTGNSKNEEIDQPTLSYDGHSTTRGGELLLSWTLFDFGERRANLDSARQLLAAANASQDASLQTVFAQTAQAYYAQISAMGALDAAKETEASAKESLMAAEAKYKAGVGTLADKLQAQTTHAQAVLALVKADGALKDARGTLALAIGLDANTPLLLDSGSTILPDTSFVRSVDALLEEAKQHHPSLLAAQAQLLAAEASVRAVTSQGLPSLSMSAALSRNDTLGEVPADTFSRNSNIGIQLKIPLFEGFARTYQIKAAQAQVALKSADLLRTQQQVALDVWKSYQALNTETENLNATEDLLNSALQSFHVAQGRYQAGVGTIIELLNAQSALADARRQRVQALSNWRSARLALAASLGKLGMWAIR